MTSYTVHIALLTIEVNQADFKHVIRAILKANATLPHLLSHPHDSLLKIKKTALELHSFPEDASYVQAIAQIQTLKKWMEYAIEIYKEVHQLEKLTSQDAQLFDPLVALENEIEGLLSQVLPLVLKKREIQKEQLMAVFMDSLLSMQKKSIAAIERFAARNQLFDKAAQEKMRKILEIFFHSFQNSSPALVDFIHSHLNEWNHLVLTQGRGLLIESGSTLTGSCLFSLQGNCYPMINQMGFLLGAGLDKLVFRSIGLPKGTIQAIGRAYTQGQKEETRLKAQKVLQFLNMWTESTMLSQLKKQVGILQLDCRLAFNIEQEKQLFLIEDYYWDGTLADYISHILHNKTTEGRFSREKERSIIEQLLQGMISIHKAGIIHHDIKPDNIFLDDSEEKIRAAIADFQLSTYTYDKKRMSFLFCRGPYAPPEYAKKAISQDAPDLASTCSFALDIWGLGLIFYVLTLHDHPPWLKQHPFKQDMELAQWDRMQLELIAALPADWLPEMAKQSLYFPLLQRMLRIHPEDRCTAEEAFALFATI